MGNNGSRTGHIAQQLETESQWTQSFPRNSSGIYQQHKVLPEKGINKKLRLTNNGEILHAGGTISGRHHQQKTLSLERENKSFKIFRTNSISSQPSEDHRQEEKPHTRYLPHHSGVSRYAAQRYENRNSHKEQIKKFGSEPDLRESISLNHRNDRDKFKGKKKYKAPAPPNHLMLEKSNLKCYQWNADIVEPLIRRSRLFKTKSELQKKCSSPLNQTLELNLAKPVCVKRNIPSKNSSNNLSNVELRNCNKTTDYTAKRLSLPEIIRTDSAPEFQTELKEVVQRIKSTKREITEANRQISLNYKYEKYSSALEKDTKEKLKTLDHNINKTENVRSRLKVLELAENKKNNAFNTFDDRGQPSGTESTSEKKETEAPPKKEQPSKLFYFGMKDTMESNLGKTNYTDTTMNHFTSTLQSYNHSYPLPNSSGSDLSSELEIDDGQVSTNGIALHLRPILPKKQLEIPRFSPAAAWKQLSAVESNFAPSTVASDDIPIFMEDRIEKLSRPPPPPAVHTGPRSSYDKSGDSGISGDAGPVGFDDSPDGIVDVRNNIQLPLVLNSKQGISWTPQQDLGEEESSTDEEMQNHNNQTLKSIPVKFTPKPNVFSLSLPRDNQFSSYINRNFGNKKDVDLSNSFRYQGGNWFLSKSAPNSLNNGLNSLDIPNSQKSEEADHGIITNSSQNMSRVMYLPESDNIYKKNQNYQVRTEKLKNRDLFRERSKSVEPSAINRQSNLLSKSFDNISSQLRSSPELQDLQDPPTLKKDTLKIYKPKRFTFQSTIRQIERKRLAEKLSKEVEKKEKQRLSEFAAMQKVEEEFQRKRAREKASIRQQLRLFSLDDTAWSSIPLNDAQDVPTRSDPDGAVSSTASSPRLPLEKKIMHTMRSPEDYPETTNKIHLPSEVSDENIRKTQMTLILSEFRQPQREYKDFRGSPRYIGEFGDSPGIKHTTVHPQVTYNMPKASSHQIETDGSSNYRKQFAHGVKTSRSGDSTYSDDSQSVSKNYSPVAYRSKKTPISRF